MDLSQLVAGALETVALAAGIEATYSRGADEVEIVVIPARSEFPTDPTRKAVALTADTQDFLTSAAGLVIGPARLRPARGDVLRMTRNGQTCVYDVVNDASEQPFRQDQTETMIRLHTRARSRT